MQNRSKSILALAAALALPIAAKAQNVLFQLPHLYADGVTTSPYALAYGLSADGSSVVGMSMATSSTKTTTGTTPYDAVEWKYNGAGGFAETHLGNLYSGSSPAKAASFAVGVTANGSQVIGGTLTTSNSVLYGDFWQTQPSPVTQTLTNIQAGNFSISQDGQVLTANGDFLLYNGKGWVPVSSLSQSGTVAPAGYSVDNFNNLSAASNVDSHGNFVVTGTVDNVPNAGGADLQQTFAYRSNTSNPNGGIFQLIGTPITVPDDIFYPAGPVNSPTNGNQMAAVSADGSFIAGVGINPNTSNEDAFEYNTITGTTWINATVTPNHLGAFQVEAITNDGSYIVGRDDLASQGQVFASGSGWIWSASTGWENIDTFLENTGGYTYPQIQSILGTNGAADVYGVTLNGNELTLTGLDGDNATSWYAQVNIATAVPEPSCLSLLAAAPLLLSRLRRHRQSV